METSFTYPKFSFLRFIYTLVLVPLLLISPGLVGEVVGQDQARTYANFQGTFERGTGALAIPVLVGSVDNAGNAANGNPKNASTLSVPIGALNLVGTTQFLEFTTDGQHSNVRTIAANTPVTVKFSLPSEVLGLLSSVSIGTFTDLQYVEENWPLLALGGGHNEGYNSTNTTQYYGGGSLLNLLNGAGEFEVTLTPTSAYNGVYLSLGSVLSLGLTADLFHAYILEDATLACDEKDEAIDALSGVRAGTVVGGIANATGSVTDSWDVIDGDPSTFALMSTGVQALSEVYHTSIFQTASRPNQVAKVVMQNPGGGLLDLSLLNGLTIQPYLRSTAVGDPINESNLLALRLLPGATDIYELIVPVAGSFDRIEIKMGGVAGVLNDLRIYEVSRLPELPIVSGLNADGVFLTCMGAPAVLNATAPNGNTINWYTVPEGGTAVTGATFTTPPITGTVTYYVSSQPVGCTTESPRVPVMVDVNPFPVISMEGPLVYTLPMGSTFNLPAAVAVNEDGSNATIVWKNPSGGTISGSSITLPNTVGTYTYRVEATGNDAAACTNFKTITITTYDPNTCPEVYLRQYATSETHTTSNLLGLVQLGQVNNPERAHDGGIKSYSELIEPANLLSLFGETSQTLSWVSPVAAGTPVTIKLAKDYSAASLLGGLYVVGVDASGNEIGPRLLAAPQIATAVNGVNVFEYTFIPADGDAVTQPYKGVKVILSAVLDVLQTARVYDAYYHNAVNQFVTCPTDAVLDIFGGYILPIGGLNAATGLLNVENPEFAVDGDPANYANMINGVGALAYSKLDVTFSTPALFGDTLSIRLDRPGAPLLDLSVLSGIRIQRFLGNKAVGEPILNTSTLLTLNLLGGGSSQADLTLVADQPFDRVQILYGGLASALQNLHVYDIHITANTSITGEEQDGDGNNTGVIEICEGDTLTLPETDCAKLVLYTDATGSTQVNLVDIEALAPGTYTYYIQAQRFGCDVVGGDRRPITIVINPSSASLITGIDVAGITDNCVDPAGNVSLIAQLSTTPADVTYQWYENTTNPGTPELMPGETASTLTLASVAEGTHTYYVSITADGYCAAAPTPVTFSVNPLGTDDDINLSSDIFQCLGIPVVLTPTSTTVANPIFRWYTDAAKTTPILDGDTDGAVTYAIDAATGVLTINGLTTGGPYPYYVTVSGDNVCENAVAKEIEVTIDASLPAPTFTAADVTLCGPGDAVFEVNNSAGGLTYELFTDELGTNPVDPADYTVSGTTITVLNASANATYYVQALGACAPADLSEINIVVNDLVPAANIDVSGTGPICAGTSTSLAPLLVGAAVTNEVFHWYSDAALTNEVHTGTVFDVAPLTTTDYYVTVSGDGVCENLADAKVVTVTVNPVPQITLDGSPTIGVFVGDSFTLPTATVDVGTITIAETTGGANTVIADPTLPITKGIGTYTYLVTATTSTCESSVIITVSVVDPAECPPGFNRIYNDAQSFDTSILGSISNEAAAGDQDPSTYAVLTEGINLLGLLGDNYQDLEWTGDLIPAGTPVTVKLGKDFNLVALAGGIRVVSINAADGEIGTPILVDGSLVSALGGNNNFEYTFTPTQDYKAVRVYVNGLVSVGQNARIYGAYYHQVIDATNPVICEEEDVRDVITGIEPVSLGGLVDVATTLVNVTAPQNAIDSDPNSYATLKNDAGVDAYAKLDIAFATPSLNGDTLQIIAGIPSGGVLDATVLGGISIQRYLGDVPVGAPLVESSSTLEVNLLPGSTERNLILYAPVDGAFDRIKIRYGGVADVALLSGKALRIYDVSRKAPTKIVGSDPDNSVVICEGGTISFPPATCNTTYRIYDAITGGNLIAEGPDFVGIESLDGGVYTFYIQPVRQGCETMDRTAFELTVNAAPVAPVVEATEVCQTATDVDVSYDVTALADHTLVYYADATTTTQLPAVPTANSAAAGTTTVYVSQINDLTGCEGERVAVSITVTAVPAPTLDELAQTFCEIDMATVADLNTDGGTGVIWYSAATGGTPLPDTDALVAGPYYAAQVVDGCESVTRTEVTVTITVTPAPNLSELTQTFCEIDMATVADLNTDGGTDVIWYSAATGGTPLVDTDALAAGVYYAAQVADGCESVDRTTVTVTITKTPAPTLTNLDQVFCEIDMPTVANLNKDGATGTVIWYTAATGGTPLAATDALVDGMYYAAQIGDNCESVDRTEVEVTITKTPAPTLTNLDQIFCEIDMPTVASLDTDGATGTVIWYTAATGGTPLAATDALVDGMYYAAQVGDNCESLLRTEVEVTITKTPAPTLTNLDQIFCEIDMPTVADLNTDGATGTVIWYTAATGGTPLADTEALVDGTYYAAQVGDNCESVVRTEVEVTITNTPAPTLTNLDQIFCEIDMPTVASLDTDGATGTVIWYTAATGGTPLAATDALVDGMYYAAQVGDNCESVDRTEVEVTITKTPAPTLTNLDQIFCEIDMPTVASLNTDGATGTVVWYTAATGGAPLAATDALADGTYYAAQVGDNCESVVRTEVEVTITKTPAPTLTNLDQIFCEIDMPTVASLDTDGATGTVVWYTAATGGAPLAATDALVDGVYYAAQVGDNCESVVRTEVEVTITKTPAPTLTNLDQIFCEIDMPTVASLDTDGATGTVIWYTAATGGTPLAATDALVDGVYYAAQVGDNCESVVRTEVEVTITKTPAPTLTNLDQVFCEIDMPTVADLNTDGATGTVIWYSAATGGTALAADAALVAGTYYAAQVGDDCESVDRTAVEVTITETPAPSLTELAQTFCEIDMATVADLNTDGATGTVIWYGAATGGTALAADAALTAGTYYAAQIADNCESVERTEVTVTITETSAPTIDNAAPEFCETDNMTLADLMVVGTDIKWYASATSTEVLPATTVLEDGVTYYATQMGDNCESADRLAVTPVITDCASLLSITKTADADRATAGESISFTLTITNEGPGAMHSGDVIKLGERPSTGLAVTGYEVTSGNATVVGTGNTAEVTTNAMIPVGGTITLTVTADVDADAPATITNGIDVWGPDKDPETDPKDDDDDTPPIPVDRESNLSITKVADEARVKAGESTSFTLTITNDGPSVINVGEDINLTERPGEGVTITGYEVTGGAATVAGNLNTAVLTTTGKIAVGGTIVVKVTADVAADAGETITNGITVWGPDKDPETDPEDDEDDTPPIPVDHDVTLSITKVADDARVVAGGSTSFTLTITNNGPAVVASGEVISLTERPGTGVTITGYEVTSGNGTADGTGNTATVTTSEAIAVGGTIVVKVTADVAADAGETITNGIDVWGPDKDPETDPKDDDDDTPPIPVDRESNLSITKVADEARVKAGESTSFTLTITNDGPSVINIGEDINLTERPGEGVAITGYEVTGGAATVAGNLNTAVLTTTGKIAVGGTIVVKVTADVAADAGETITNGITVWGPDKDPETDPEDDRDDTPPIPVDRESNLSITKVADEARVQAGESTSFTLTITNDGPAVVASGEVISLTERPGTGVTITGYEVTSGNGTADGTGNMATVTTSEAIAVGGTIVVKVTADVAADAGETITNGITVWGPDKDPETDPEDDEDDTPPIPVDHVSVLGITKVADDERVIAGGTTSFTVTVTNNGPATIAVGETIAVEERPSDGLTVTGYEVTSGNATVGGTGNNPMLTTTAAIAVGGTITFTVSADVTAPAGATISNGIAVWGPDKDPGTDPEDDEDETPEIPVDRPYTLSIEKVADQSLVTAGEATSFTITVTNNGPLDIQSGEAIALRERPGTGVSITGYEIISGAATVSGTGNTATLTTTGVIGVGATISVRITGDVAETATGTITNGISVWGPDSNPDTDEPDDEDDINPIPVDATLHIPNVFTPNGDGLNDRFVIKNLLQYQGRELTVINRWGNQVFKSDNYNNDWDGGSLAEGTYYYILRYRNGGDWKTAKGPVAIIRVTNR